jgi:hypothetical protein
MRFISLIIFLFLFLQVRSQNAYIVYFTDKNGSTFNPYEYFDQKAIERRLLQEIPLFDETDYPVNQSYIDQVAQFADSMGFDSRWFNFSVAFVSDETHLVKIKGFPFVKKVELVEPVESGIAACKNDFRPGINDHDIGLLRMQTERMGGKLFDSLGFDGKGMRIAIFDAGFTSARSNPIFDSIRKQKHFIAAKDFTRKKNGNVFYGSAHGTEVLTCIAGQYMGHKFGMATAAEILLAKTEVSTEPYYEELNWLAAVEWADKLGADIINSSLAYTGRRYFTSQMDGKSSLVVKAANLAARKGMLVVNAAGNDGDKKWKTIATPADGDSVLTVGGIDPDLDYHINFSSFGPSADKRLKPNVSAYGKVVTSSPNKITTAFGTSFASPLVAGFAACAWQSKRSLSNMQLFHEIEKSGHLYPYFDYAHGYGIPQASYFLSSTGKKIRETFHVSQSVDDSLIHITIDTNIYDFDKNISTQDTFTINIGPVTASKPQTAKLNANYPDGRNDLLFYHVQDKNGKLKMYYLISVDQAEVLTLPKKDFEPGEKVRLFYNGYMKEIDF